MHHRSSSHSHLLSLLLITTTISRTISTTTIDPTNQPTSNANKSLCINCNLESLDFLFSHNLVRASHHLLPLLWDPKLELYARRWATERRGDCALEHSFPPEWFEVGENIFWGGGSEWWPRDAVRDWADEEKYYDYESNSCKEGEMCGHYTQIVWRNTWRVGCAREVCESGDVFITCNYYPPGNYVGERPY